MRIAKKGFEVAYETLEAKQKALAEEKETAKAEACAKVDAEFEAQEKTLNIVLNELSEEIPDPIPETDAITENFPEDVCTIGDYDATPQYTVTI